MPVEHIELGPGLNSEVIRTAKPLRIGSLEELAAHDPITIPRFEGDDVQSSSWLGVPILASGRVLGAVDLEREEAHAFSDADERLLATLASSMGVALENARLFDETKRLLTETDQRNAELAVVNEIGAALAAQLDFEAIIDLVGERVRTIFEAPTAYIALYDRPTNEVTFPYFVDQGTRVEGSPIQLGPGLTSEVIRTRRPLRYGTVDEINAHGALTVGGDAEQSWLGVPILAGDDVIGVLSVQHDTKHAFGEADERLLSTLASSMGVALENARLFGETKRLLTETDERAAELAVVNEIGAALAEQLDFDAIIEIVGERIGNLFTAHTLDIALHDPATETISFPFSTLDGERTASEALPLGEGLTSRIITTRRPIRLGSSADADALGAIWREDEPRTESYLGVPIVAGDRAIGTIALIAAEANAYSEDDERLLSTFASSMGVALENARLFDETKRLLTETDAARR